MGGISTKTLREIIGEIWDKIFKDKQELEYTNLAPVDKIENGEEYLKALDWALENKKIKNIALAGPFGSGKSSIIETYLKNRKPIQKKSIRISMAAFVENKKSEDGNNGLLSLEPEEVEIGILKQLFYKVNYRKIPQSRYRKIHKISRIYIWLCLLAFFMAAVVVTFVFFRDNFNLLITKIEAAGYTFGLGPKMSLVIFSILVVGFLAIVSNLYRSIFPRFKINEVKLPMETTLGRIETANDSIFNKNMDEIVYFFEETKYRFVFFEDLDRLENSMIFVHLRELNTILNNYELIKKPIVFIYAIKDDVFADKDRTKFFDFIIPVIPIINSTNSGEIFLQKIDKSKKMGISHELSQGFILDIAPYVEDMRILQNIYNEFIVYKNTIRIEQDLKLLDEAMMALIVFKNLYPKDFADIQLEKGIIKKAFVDKENYINNIHLSTHREIAEKEDTIKAYKNEHIKEIKELKLIMLTALASWKGIVYKIDAYQSSFNTDNILNDSFDLSSLGNVENCTIRFTTWNNANSNARVDSCKNILSPYMKRIELLQRVHEKGILHLKEEIEQKQKEEHEISRWTLKKLLERFGVDEVLSEEVRQNSLLVFLLRRGYIDETYTSYINYFKGTSITKGDMNFILAIKNEEQLSFNYQLSKVDMVVKQLQLYEFEQKSIYNFNLLDYLLSNPSEREKMEVFLRQLSDGTEKSWKFIDEFVDCTENRGTFIRLLSGTWYGLWDAVSNNDILTYERKNFYLSLLICETKISCLVKLNNNSSKGIKKFIEGHPDILQKLTLVDDEKWIMVIKGLDIKFKDLVFENVSEKVLNYIFDHNCYEINKTMVERIIAYKAQGLSNQMEKQNYTTVLKVGYTPLIDYIYAFINDYVKEIVLSKENTKETVTSIIDLLERIIADTSLCLEVIHHEYFCIESFTECCSNIIETHPREVESIWNGLLQENKVCLNWENISQYWFNFGFTEQLIQYIEEHGHELSLLDFSCIGTDFTQEFIESKVSKDTLCILLPQLKVKDILFNIEKIAEENVAILIQINYILFNSTNYEMLNKIYPNLCIEFIIHNQKQYMELIDEIPIDIEQFNTLFFHSQLDVETRNSLLNAYGMEYMTEDLAYKILDLDVKLNIQLFDKIWRLLNEKGKRRLMLKELQLLDADKFEACFKELPTWYSGFGDRSRMQNVKIENTPEHCQLAERLKEVSYITSFKTQVKKTTGDTDDRGELLICKIKAVR